MNASFSQLPLNQSLLDNLETLGYVQMTPIQEQSLPSILQGRDVIAQARTGSGKTLAFGLGVLAHLHVKTFRIQALLICPTRELASQVAKELRRMARAMHNVKILELCGGTPMKKQIHSLSHQAHIVVGTPGRLLAHLERDTLSLEHLNTLVLDEADRMLDMGFYDDISAIIATAPKTRQTLLFSATFSEEIRQLSQQFLNHAVEIHVKQHKRHTPQITEHFYRIPEATRQTALFTLLGHYQKERILIFCNTKIGCDTIADALYDSGIDALAIHSDLEQFAREETLILFANGSCNILVATDVAARGLDIDAVDLVLNYELPYEDAVYVHRIGRTGRAGKNGLSVSLCRGDEPLFEQRDPLTWHTLESLDNLAPYSTCAPMATLFISGGKKEKLRPGDIVGALTANAAISADAIGTITIFDAYSYVALRKELADTALQILQNDPIKGRQFRVKRLKVT